jgi:hypothetical protein
MFLRNLALSAALLAAGIAIGASYAGATATGTDVSVRGLENTTQQLAQMKDNKNAQQALIVLQVLQAVGKRQQPEGGVSRFDYHVDVSPQGSVVINNIDISAITQMTKSKN